MGGIEDSLVTSLLFFLLSPCLEKKL